MATEAEEKTTKAADLGPEVFDDYDAFLKHAIREYYDRGWKSRRGNFIALVIASGQVMSMAADSIRDGSGLKKAALGEEVAAAETVRLFDPKERYKAGEIIAHPEFGRGKIENVLRSSLLVRFPVGGLKSLMLL